MRLRLVVLISVLATIAYCAPVNEQDDTVTTTVEPVTEISTSEPEESPTTLQPNTDDAEVERKARQLDEDGDDDESAEQDDDDDDDEEEEDADEEEEEERKLPANRVSVKPASKKKASQIERKTKPVPVLVEGVEDDEAEDLGIFEREDSKTGSNEKSDEEKSDEEKADDDNEDEDDEDDDDDESGEDDDDQDDDSESTGLIDEPSSSERGDVEELTASGTVENNPASSNQEPLAIAVVQPEVEASDPVVPIIVEEASKNSASSSQSSQSAKKTEKSSKNKPQRDEEDDDDDDDDDDEDEDEDDDETKERSEKVIKARSAYPSPVLYYYPFPETRVEPQTAY